MPLAADLLCVIGVRKLFILNLKPIKQYHRFQLIGKATCTAYAWLLFRTIGCFDPILMAANGGRYKI
jgi:hypothetical protein